jgi:hypothetical protein
VEMDSLYRHRHPLKRRDDLLEHFQLWAETICNKSISIVRCGTYYCEGVK